MTASNDSPSTGKDLTNSMDHDHCDRDTPLEVPGGVLIHRDSNRETEIHITNFPGGIELKLSNETGQWDTLLTPDDVESLCQRLLEAKEEYETGDTHGW